jgi:GT2 family glycosyltransferase
LAKGEYLCFLNSDTGVESTFVQRNVEILDSDSSIGGVTCIVVDQSGKNWFTGGRYVRGVPHNLHDDFQGVRTVEFIAGTAAFYRKDVFDRIGSFDENYIMYHEDIEFGLRVRKKTNYRLCTFSDKLVTHYIVPSIPGKALWYYASRNLVLLSKKYNLRYMPMVMAHILIHYAGIHVIRGVYIATFALRGVFDGLTGRTSHFNQ